MSAMTLFIHLPLSIRLHAAEGQKPCLSPAPGPGPGTGVHIYGCVPNERMIPAKETILGQVSQFFCVRTPFSSKRRCQKQHGKARQSNRTFLQMAPRESVPWGTSRPAGAGTSWDVDLKSQREMGLRWSHGRQSSAVYHQLTPPPGPPTPTKSWTSGSSTSFHHIFTSPGVRGGGSLAGGHLCSGTLHPA